MNASTAIKRSGTGQADRIAEELSEEFVAIEEHSIAEQLHFARKIAGHIRYFNDENEEDGTWASFFSYNSIDIADIEAYIADPEAFAVNEDAMPAIRRQQWQKLRALSRPHLVLFLTFLQLTQRIRSRFNELTREHLDFYYKEVLQIDKKGAAQDKVHLLFELADGVPAYTIPKGTLLNGGTDAAGIPLQYAIDETFTVNQAKIEEIKTLRLKRGYLSLNDIRKAHTNGFELMLRWALGQYFQGDVLPPYPLGLPNDEKVDIDFLSGVYQRTKGNTNIDQQDLTYIKEILGFVSLPDFNYCMDIYERSIDTNVPYPPEEQWVEVAQRIEAAFDARWYIKRMELLIDIYRPSANSDKGRIEPLFQQVFGNPGPDHPMPAFPSVDDDLITLYNTLSAPDSDADEAALANRYITQYLGLHQEDYLFILEQHLNASEELYDKPYHEILEDANWLRVFKILVRAETVMRELTPPTSGRWDIRNVAVREGVVFDGTTHTPAFGLEAASKDPDDYFSPGLAVVSPLLHLEEGKRAITVEVTCKKKDFPFDDLQAAKANGLLHFDVLFSGKEEWLKLDSYNDPTAVQFEMDLIGKDLTTTYPFSGLTLICAIDTLGHPIQNIIFEDGSIWQVAPETPGTDNGRYALSYLSTIEGITNNDIILPDLSFEETGILLPDLEYIDYRNEVTLPAMGSDRIAQGDFIRFYDGEIVIATQVFDGGARAKVKPLGYYPETGPLNENNPPLKYTALTFRERHNISDINLLSVRLKDKKFSRDDLHSTLVFPSGMVLELIHLVPPTGGNTLDTSTVQEFEEALVLGLSPKTYDPSVKGNQIQQYVTYPGFRFKLFLDGDAAPVTSLPEPLAMPGLHPKEPVIKIQLKNRLLSKDGTEVVDIAYEHFANIRLHSVKLEVAVEGLETLKLANGTDVFKAGKPFQPFGYQPHEDAAFYFSHHELSRKKPDSMEVRLKWVDLPDSFSEYYEAYTNSGIKGIPTTLDNDSFKVRTSLFNIRSWVGLEGDKELFLADNQDTSTLSYEEGFSSVVYDLLEESDFSSSDSPLNEKQYFRLTLQDPGLQHKAYPHVARKLALQGDTTVVNEPYTPTVSAISINYTASEEITPSLYDEDEGKRSFLAHIHPFGAIDVDHSISETQPQRGAHMLPHLQDEAPIYLGQNNLQDEGVLYLGLSRITAGSEVSLLIQVVAGTGNASLDTPDLHWYYRTTRGWKPFPVEDLLEDTTRGMTFSGIVRLRLPEDATDHGPLMPQGKHWISVHAPEDAHSGAKILDIKAQAGGAVLQVTEAHAAHKVLPPNSISGFVNNIPAISQVKQPYSSFGGAAAELDETYYQRVSERLRHKGRAVTAWDYERLVLESFPEVAYVKCLNQGEMPGLNKTGEMALVVVPDLRNVSPYFPLEPGVAPETIEKVQETMDGLSPVFSKVMVKNPTLEPVIYRVAVRFNKGYGQGTYRRQLNEEIEVFLSPWIRDNTREPSFGNSIYLSALIYHLERLPYVDYIASAKAFRKTTLYEGTDDEEQHWTQVFDDPITVSRPDSILTSHTSHVVDVISSEHYKTEDYMGIGYMIIELDNVVR